MIENALHYVKDVTFGEDGSTIRIGHAPTNFSIVIAIAMTAYGNEGYKSFPQAIQKNAFKIGKLMKLLGCWREMALEYSREKVVENKKFVGKREVKKG